MTTGVQDFNLIYHEYIFFYEVFIRINKKNESDHCVDNTLTRKLIKIKKIVFLISYLRTIR